MKRKILTIIFIAAILITIIVLFVINIPVIGYLAHENTIIVSTDETHTVLYETFKDHFNISYKGRFAGICRDKYNNYLAYYVKGDTSHEYLYVDGKFFRKAVP